MSEIDFKKIEKKWQERWEKEKTFEPKKSEKKKVFLTVPYPYTSGPLHIGHGRTYTISDSWIRFKRLQGYNCLWPMAFHISGTPIIVRLANPLNGGLDACGRDAFGNIEEVYH